jgi:acylphosphatase
MESSDRQHARIHLKIAGRVQGVYFRASTVNQAERLRLTGWVRNCHDGSVEVVAEGPRAQLDELATWCRQGPPGAIVEQFQIDWQEPRQEFHRFQVKR